MKIFTDKLRRLSALVIMCAVFAPSAFAQDAPPAAAPAPAPAPTPAPAAAGQPKIAVYVTGGVSDEKKKIIGTRLLVALVNTGRYASIERPAEFAAAADGARAGQPGAAAESGVYAAAAAFGAAYVCMTDVSAHADDYQIFARVIDAKTAEVAAIGDFYGPIKAAAELKPALDELVETMFPPPKAAAPPPQQPQPYYTADAPMAPATPPALVYMVPMAPMAPAPAAPAAPAAAPPALVYAAGEAKTAAERVAAAVSAFNDATNKSIAAANAVTAAAQSGNFSAIRDAKQKVESAAAAVKKAKTDVTAALEALKTAGPEAEAAVKAMGLDLSMFGGSAGGGAAEDDEGEGGGGKGNRRFYFTPKYQSPVGSPVSWGGLNAEIGWVWRNGFLFGIDFGFGADSYGDLIGGGFSFGKVYDFANQMQIAYGGSVGFWHVGLLSYSSANFLAPFVKYRYKSLEVMYRGLMGVGSGFGYNSHQTLLGYYMPSKWKGGGEKNAHFYFAPKYQMPVGTPVSWGGVNTEFGWVWRNGFLFGFDLNFGYSRDGDWDYTNYRSGTVGGILFNFGKEYDIGHQMRVAFGGSTGVLVSDGGEHEYSGRYETSRYNGSINFLGPFVRWRVNVFEITYRGLLGTYWKEVRKSYDYGNEQRDPGNGYYYGHNTVEAWDVDGFGYNGHQLTVGFHFGGSPRKK